MRTVGGGKTDVESVTDVEELRRAVRYTRKLADQLAGRLVEADTTATRLRHELEQKRRGSSLLSQLIMALETNMALSALTKTVASRVATTLAMDRAVILARDEAGPAHFKLVAWHGYSPAEIAKLDGLRLIPSPLLTTDRKAIVVTKSEPARDDDTLVQLGIPFYVAVPIIVEGQAEAILVTGRNRDQKPFSPRLDHGDVSTLGAIAGFMAANITRIRMLERERDKERERYNQIEREVALRTTELESQKLVLEDSLHRLRQTQDQLVVKEKLASLGQLTAGIAHEIKNPLNFISNFSTLSVDLVRDIRELIEPARAYLGDETRREFDDSFDLLAENLSKIRDHGRRADRIVRSMLQHSRTGVGERRATEVNSLVNESVDLAYHGVRAQDPGLNLVIERDIDRNLGSAYLVPQDISRVIVNLVTNAVYSVSKRRREGGDPHYRSRIRIATRLIDDGIEIRIRDNGIGISPQVMERLFTPFFTTKPIGEGTGLGLSLSYDIIVKGHQGRLHAESQQNDYAEFIIWLPRGTATPTGAPDQDDENATVAQFLSDGKPTRDGAEADQLNAETIG